MTYGETAVAEVAIRNNGSEPWPAGVRLAAVDAYSSPTRERESVFAILPGDTTATSGTWISASVVGEPDVKNLPPGQVTYFRMPLRAPASQPGNKSVTFRENFNLVDAQGHWFSEDWQTGPSNRQIYFRVAVVPPRSADDVLPLEETGAGGKPSLKWRLKNGGEHVLEAAADAPAFPTQVTGPVVYAEVDNPRVESEEGPTTSTVQEDAASTSGVQTQRIAANSMETSVPVSIAGPGAGTVALRLHPATGQDYEMAMVGDPQGTDYAVESWVYCDYRPVPRGHGYERAGIFMHDSGQHRITAKTELENGDCLLMAYDSNTGRVHAGNWLNGGLADSARESSTTLIDHSGWHKFAMRAKGPVVTYELDGTEIASTQGSGRGRRGGWRRGGAAREDNPRAPLRYGDCGVFSHYLSLPETDEHHGLLFAGFKVKP
jgi:hypothetical protein